jgi:HK97 family phage portal protein
MGIMQALRNLARPRYQVVVAGAQLPMAAGMDAVQLYRTQPNLRAVVSFLADNAASVPWKVYDRVADGDRERVTDSPAALLLSRPSPDLTAYELRRRIFGDLYIADRHLSIVRADDTTPSGWSIWPVPFTWLDGYIGGTVYRPDAFVVSPPSGFRVEVPAESCLWLHGYDPADPMGQASPVEALRDLLMEQVESAAFRRQMWTRGGRFNAYVTRPKDVEKWNDEAFERFRRTWNESWAGRDGSQAGAMPILEDGMEIKQVQFNARDAEWSEAKRLGREDVAGVYHINPALIWPGSGQTYASAKDNARALYNDTLSPKLMEVTDKINAQLLPMVGEDSRHYVEYDLQVKLQGAFDERASVLQSAVGGPFMLRNEARAQFNLPAIDGGDELIVPLNVVTGGLASPNDTDPTIDRYDGPSDHKCGCPDCKAQKSEVQYKAEPLDEESREFADAFAKFFERQARSVLPKIRAAKAAGSLAKDAAEWWDVTRWDKELAADLEVIARGQSDIMARRALQAIGVPDDEYDPDEASAFLADMCRVRAEYVNATTRAQLERSLELEAAGAEGLMATPEGVFENAVENRTESAGAAIAAAVDGWSALEAVRQCAPDQDIRKRWVVTSSNPRPSHRAMDGQTVPVDDRFSNGMQWPGDWAGGPDEVCGCQCEIALVYDV